MIQRVRYLTTFGEQIAEEGQTIIVKNIKFLKETKWRKMWRVILLT